MAGAGRHAIRRGSAAHGERPTNRLFHSGRRFPSLSSIRCTSGEFFRREFGHFQKSADAPETLSISATGFHRFLPLLILVIDRLLIAVAPVKRARCRTVVL